MGILQSDGYEATAMIDLLAARGITTEAQVSAIPDTEWFALIAEAVAA